MSFDLFEGVEGARPSAAKEAAGVLEDPNKVRGEWDQDVVSQYGHVASLVGSTQSAYLELEDVGLVWFDRRFERLDLTHRGAMLFLEGAPLQSLMGGVVLLQYKLRPPHAPKPGADDVRVAVIDRNPQGLTIQDIFFRIHEGALEGAVRAEA